MIRPKELQEDIDTIKTAFWVARDLSIRFEGQMPDEVREAPAALSRLIARIDNLEREGVQ